MSSWRSFSILVALMFLATDLSAVEPPKSGRQWITFGFALNPGFLHDKNGEARGVTNDAMNLGVGYRIGLTHALTPSIYMAAEGELGTTYFRPHTASPIGVAGSENAFSWQIGLVGRYLPLGDEGGPTFGLGLHLFRVALDDAGLQTLSADARVGWLLWENYKFVAFEFGYSFPALSGLNTPAFEVEGEELIDKTWNFHRFGLTLTYGF